MNENKHNLKEIYNILKKEITKFSYDIFFISKNIDKSFYIVILPLFKGLIDINNNVEKLHLVIPDNSYIFSLKEYTENLMKININDFRCTLHKDIIVNNKYKIYYDYIVKNIIDLNNISNSVLKNYDYKNNDIQAIINLLNDYKYENHLNSFKRNINNNYICFMNNIISQDLNILNKETNLLKYSNIFLTSDIHFGHKNIIKYENRDKKLNINDIEQHDNILIENWNKVVSKNDVTFILGDLSFYNAEKTNELLSRLNGDKILIIGNHDFTYLNKLRFDKTLFQEICYYKEFKYDKYNICLMHYPIMSFNGMNHDNPESLHFCGHIHSEPYKLCKHCYNVGVDINKYTPIHINDAIKKALLNKGDYINGT